ncbi:hypothetical protein MBANPS3_009424, partial [Mucor bainieri]
MLPLPVSTFITQIVALLTVAAISRIAILCAYRLKDIDIRLMYQENIFRHLGWYTDYHSDTPRKQLAFLLALLGLAASFLPTFLSITGDVSDNEHVSYANIQKSTTNYYELSPKHFRKENHPIFTNLYDNSRLNASSSSAAGEANSTTGILLENYLQSAHRKTTPNPSGVWYNVPAFRFSPEEQLRQWRNDANYPPSPQVNQQGVFSLQEDQWPTYFLSYNNKAPSEGSSTLKHCVDNDPSGSNLVNLPSIDGHQVQAAQAMNRTCYPMADPSLWLVAAQSDGSYKEDSKLNFVDSALFRSGYLDQQTTATYAMGVSANNWGQSGHQKAFMIKKSAHITVFYSDKTKALVPETCMPAFDNSIKHLFHQDINFIVCQLAASAKQNPALPILQATKRTYDSNNIINAVYTYLQKDNGHGIMIDLTLLSAYYTSGYTKLMLDRDEALIAYQKIQKTDFDTTDYEQLLQSMNLFPDVNTVYGLNTITDLVVVGSHLLDGEANEDFTKTKAKVVAAIKPSVPWIVVTCSLTVLSLLVCTVVSRLAPTAYKTDLRSLLVHTLINQEKTNSNTAASNNDPTLNRQKKTGLVTRAVRLETSKTASLKMDGVPVVLSEKIPLK